MIADKQRDQPSLEQVARLYGFRELRVERELTGGMFARPIVVQTDRGTFVQRVHRFRNTEPAFRFQAEVTNAASRLGVVCPRIEPTCDGAWCVDAAGGVVAVHEFLEGTCDSWAEWQDRKRDQRDFLHDLGRLVARLHDTLRRIEPRGDARLDYQLPPIQFGQLERTRSAWQRGMEKLRTTKTKSEKHSREAMLSFEARIEKFWDMLMGACSDNALAGVRAQIVHGDVSPVNIVFTPTGDMAFIDWDCVHIGHRVYDALGDVLNRAPHDGEAPTMFSREEVVEYLEGYESKIAEPLTNNEKRLVPAFCLARQLEDLRQRLRVIPDLVPSQDAIYAQLIAMRVETMEQIELN